MIATASGLSHPEVIESVTKYNSEHPAVRLLTMLELASLSHSAHLNPSRVALLSAVRQHHLLRVKVLYSRT